MLIGLVHVSIFFFIIMCYIHFVLYFDFNNKLLPNHYIDES